MAILAAAFAALAQTAFLWWPRTVDDAYITFRYASNLAAGFGPVFNPGERVEGYSSPSWMLLSAAAIAAGIDPVPVAKWAGLAAAAALVLALDRGLRRSGTVPWGAALAAFALGSSFTLGIWSVAGMETAVYALFFFCGLAALAREDDAVRGSRAGSAWLAAAALTRPEGLAFWLAGALVRPRLLRVYAAPGLALTLHLGWRLFYYGAPLPNTYYAKTGGGVRMWLQGLHGLAGFAATAPHMFWLLAAAAGLAIAWSRPATRHPGTVFGLAVLLHLLYVVAVGDDGLYVYRFYVPVLAPLGWLAAQLLPRAGAPRRTLLALAGVTALALSAATSLVVFHARVLPSQRSVAADYQEGNLKLGRALAQGRPPGTLIAVAAAGAIPYYSGLPAIDMYGLNDAHIARRPFSEAATGRLMKWDMDYVLARRPALIVINRGYFAAGDPIAERVRRDPSPLLASPMDVDLFEHLRRDGTYLPRTIEFDDGSVFFVFERSH